MMVRLFVGEDLETVVRFHAVFRDVEALHFFFSGNPDAHDCLGNVECEVAHSECPDEAYYDTDDLGGEQCESAAVEEAACAVVKSGSGEESASQGSPCSTHAVYGNRTNRVVDFEHFINELDGEYNQHTCDETDNQGSCRGYCCTGSGNTNQSCQRAVTSHGDIRFAVFEPRGEHCTKGTRTGGEACSYSDQTDGAVSSGGGTGVETEPAEPEDEYTK